MDANENLYHYKKRLKHKVERIKNLPYIPKKSKAKIIEFQEDCIADGIGAARILRYLDDLPKIVLFLKKDFEKATEKDIKKIVRKIEETDLSYSSKLEVKKTLKKFYKWLNGGEEYPECVKWIKGGKKNNNKLPEELLTEEEAKKMIAAARTLRDRALISILWESGCRAGEILTLKIKHISFEENLTRILVYGKTGPRRVPLLDATPYLAEWIENHPFRDNPGSWLWVGIGAVGRDKMMTYPALRKMLSQVGKKAKIKKRTNPHNFRHSRATFLAKHLTEAQMNQYLGWVRGSDMPATYVHLSGRDMDDAILKLRGMEPKKEKVESTLKPKKCPRCELVNKATGRFCTRCGAVLDLETAVSYQDEIKKLDDQFSKVLSDEKVQKFLVKRMIELGMQ